jgi:broad specificity phosphatase PhoE
LLSKLTIFSLFEVENDSKKIYIIRHGETDFNRLGIVQGSGVDTDLNEKGKQQALAFFEHFKNESFDKIYSSTLKRTHQSVIHFIEKGLKWSQHDGLNEISWGKREGKTPDASDNKYFAEITQNWTNGETHLKFEDGESPQEVSERQMAFLNLILQEKSEKKILIAMHGRALKILLSKIIHNDLSKMDSFDHTNLCLYLLTYNYSTNLFELILENDTTHLNSLKNTQ